MQERIVSWANVYRFHFPTSFFHDYWPILIPLQKDLLYETSLSLITLQTNNYFKHFRRRRIDVNDKTYQSLDYSAYILSNLI